MLQLESAASLSELRSKFSAGPSLDAEVARPSSVWASSKKAVTEMLEHIGAAPEGSTSSPAASTRRS